MFRQDNKVYPSEEEIPFYAKQTRLVLKNCGHIDAERIEAAIAAGAYEGLEKALFEMTPKAVIQAITDSKLRGRGGAGFPAGKNGARWLPRRRPSAMWSAMATRATPARLWTAASWRAILTE